MIFCDNASENKTLGEIFTKTIEEIKFEFTSPGNPQKNVVVGRGCATLYSCMHLMIDHTRLHENFNIFLCPKCAATATKLENIMVDPDEEKCAHEKFCFKMPDYA